MIQLDWKTYTNILSLLSKLDNNKHYITFLNIIFKDHLTFESKYFYITGCLYNIDHDIWVNFYFNDLYSFTPDITFRLKENTIKLKLDNYLIKYCYDYNWVSINLKLQQFYFELIKGESCECCYKCKRTQEFIESFRQ